MTDTLTISLLSGAIALGALVAFPASAQTPDTRIEVIGAINAPGHIQPVTDGRDDSVPEIPVVYESQSQNARGEPQGSPQTRKANQAPPEPASTEATNLGQTVKSQ